MDEKSLLISHLEAEIKNSEANLSSLQTNYNDAIKQLGIISDKTKIEEEQLHERRIIDDSRLAEYRLLAESLTKDRDTAVADNNKAQQVVEKLSYSLGVAKSSISLLNGVIMDKLNFMNSSVDGLQSKFKNGEDVMVKASQKLKENFEIKRSLLEENRAYKSLVDDKQSNNYQKIENLESTIKCQNDTINAFEMALIEAQKYMDEKEHLAEERLSELSKLQNLYSTVLICVVLLKIDC